MKAKNEQSFPEILETEAEEIEKAADIRMSFAWRIDGLQKRSSDGKKNKRKSPYLENNLKNTKKSEGSIKRDGS